MTSRSLLAKQPSLHLAIPDTKDPLLCPSQVACLGMGQFRSPAPLAAEPHMADMSPWKSDPTARSDLSPCWPALWFPGLRMQCVHAKSLWSCLTLCNPMDRSPSGSSVHGVLQARILGWVAMHSSRGSSWPWEGCRDWTCVSYVSCTGKRILYDYSHLETGVGCHPLLQSILSTRDRA